MALFSDASSTVHLVNKATVNEALGSVALSTEALSTIHNATYQPGSSE